MPVVPASQAVNAGESLKPRSSGPTWTGGKKEALLQSQVPLNGSLSTHRMGTEHKYVRAHTHTPLESPSSHPPGGPNKFSL